MYLIDTNVLLTSPDVLETFEGVALSIRVIEELDNLKIKDNQETAYSARRASHAIRECKQEIKFIFDRKNKLSVDDDLVRLAKKYKYTLLTNDLNVAIKANARKVDTRTYYGNKGGDYNGVSFFGGFFPDQEFIDEYILSLEESKEQKFFENEYIVLGNIAEYKEVFFGRYNKGKITKIEDVTFSNPYTVGKVKARNAEQRCLMNLLADKDISIVYAGGNYGTGKSFLMLNYALQELEKGNISKIVYVPNNAFNENTLEIGALPGGLLEKEIIHMGTLVDIAGDQMIVEQLVSQGKIELVPISIMRGRNITNSIIIVNEAQNLTESHIKLLIGRCGDGTRLFFDGDIKQTDHFSFRNKNGLKLLLKLRFSEEYASLFGYVRLEDVERSKTASAADYLDNL